MAIFERKTFQIFCSDMVQYSSEMDYVSESTPLTTATDLNGKFLFRIATLNIVYLKLSFGTYNAIRSSAPLISPKSLPLSNALAVRLAS